MAAPFAYKKLKAVRAELKAKHVAPPPMFGGAPPPPPSFSQSASFLCPSCR